MTPSIWGLAKNGKAVHLINPDTGRALCPDTKHAGNHYTIMKIFKEGEWHPDYPMTCQVCRKYHDAELAKERGRKEIQSNLLLCDNIGGS